MGFDITFSLHLKQKLSEIIMPSISKALDLGFRFIYVTPGNKTLLDRNVEMIVQQIISINTNRLDRWVDVRYLDTSFLFNFKEDNSGSKIYISNLAYAWINRYPAIDYYRDISRYLRLLFLWLKEYTITKCQVIDEESEDGLRETISGSGNTTYLEGTIFLEEEDWHWLFRSLYDNAEFYDIFFVDERFLDKNNLLTTGLDYFNNERRLDIKLMKNNVEMTLSLQRSSKWPITMFVLQIDQNQFAGTVDVSGLVETTLCLFENYGIRHLNTFQLDDNLH